MAFLAAIPAAIGSVFGGGFGQVLGAVGTVLSGISAYGAAQYQQRVGEMNAEIAEDNATRARERAQVEAQEQDDQTRALLGQQLAAQSASGLDIGGRSQILTRKAARRLGRKDALNVAQAGEIEAYNYRVEAANQRASANLAGAQGQSSLLASFIGAGQSLIGGAKSTARASRFDPWVTKSGMSLRMV
jgi:hypothetical protein